jgi:hypothetical protein
MAKSKRDRAIQAFDKIVREASNELTEVRPHSPRTPQSHPTEIALERFRILLQKASERQDKVAFATILQVWLRIQKVDWPTGVFKFDAFSPEAGRPSKDSEAQKIIECYASMEKPTFGQVAMKLFPDEYNRDPKKAADRVRQQYNRRKRTLFDELQSYLERP